MFSHIPCEKKYVIVFKQWGKRIKIPHYKHPAWTTAFWEEDYLMASMDKRFLIHRDDYYIFSPYIGYGIGEWSILKEWIFRSNQSEFLESSYFIEQTNRYRRMGALHFGRASFCKRYRQSRGLCLEYLKFRSGKYSSRSCQSLLNTAALNSRKWHGKAPRFGIQKYHSWLFALNIAWNQGQIVKND